MSDANDTTTLPEFHAMARDVLCVDGQTRRLVVADDIARHERRKRSAVVESLSRMRDRIKRRGGPDLGACVLDRSASVRVPDRGDTPRLGLDASVYEVYRKFAKKNSKLRQRIKVNRGMDVERGWTGAVTDAEVSVPDALQILEGVQKLDTVDAKSVVPVVAEPSVPDAMATGEEQGVDDEPATVTEHPAVPEQTMTSKEVAELAGKLHKNVLRDIRKVLAALAQPGDTGSDLSPAEKARQGVWDDFYVGKNGKLLAMYQLNRRFTDILLVGYDYRAAARVVDRWHALEKGEAVPAYLQAQQGRALPETIKRQEAAQILDIYMDVATRIMQVPPHLALNTAVFKVAREQGVDFSEFSKQSVLMHISEEERWLEPTPAVAFLQCPRIKTPNSFNKAMEYFGKQKYVVETIKGRRVGMWVATDAAKGFAEPNVWHSTETNKSGQNYKWNMAKVKALLEESGFYNEEAA